jgi:ribosomal protein S6--L-glutamate ligase
VLIEKASHVAGLTLGQSGLRESDLMVLSIERGEGVIPVHKAQSNTNVGDRLICYEKLENLKELVLIKVTPSTKQNQGKPKGGRND